MAEERRGQAGAGDDYGGCYGSETALLWAKKEAGKCENGALLSAGERWSVEAALRRVVAYAVRATATRGHRDLHVALGSCRCRPLNILIQSIQTRNAEPDDTF